jgi:hypothetical protein
MNPLDDQSLDLQLRLNLSDAALMFANAKAENRSVFLRMGAYPSREVPFDLIREGMEVSQRLRIARDAFLGAVDAVAEAMNAK